MNNKRSNTQPAREYPRYTMCIALAAPPWNHPPLLALRSDLRSCNAPVSLVPGSRTTFTLVLTFSLLISDSGMSVLPKLQQEKNVTLRSGPRPVDETRTRRRQRRTVQVQVKRAGRGGGEFSCRVTYVASSTLDSPREHKAEEYRAREPSQESLRSFLCVVQVSASTYKNRLVL